MNTIKEICAYAKDLGWEFFKQGGRHEIWRHTKTGRKTSIPRGARCHSRTLKRVTKSLEEGAK